METGQSVLRARYIGRRIQVKGCTGVNFCKNCTGCPGVYDDVLSGIIIDTGSFKGQPSYRLDCNIMVHYYIVDEFFNTKFNKHKERLCS
jgi:hypothetical protein